MLHWRYLLHDTNSDRHTRVLNVLGQLAPDWGIKFKKKIILHFKLNLFLIRNIY